MTLFNLTLVSCLAFKYLKSFGLACWPVLVLSTLCWLYMNTITQSFNIDFCFNNQFKSFQSHFLMNIETVLFKICLI